MGSRQQRQQILKNLSPIVAGIFLASFFPQKRSGHPSHLLRHHPRWQTRHPGVLIWYPTVLTPLLQLWAWQRHLQALQPPALACPFHALALHVRLLTWCSEALTLRLKMKQRKSRALTRSLHWMPHS